MNWNPELFVIDTGVILSRVIRPASTPALALELALRQGVLLASEETLQELEDVLLRPKFDSYISKIQRLRFLAEFGATVERVAVREHVRECRDVRDDKFWRLRSTEVRA